MSLSPSKKRLLKDRLDDDLPSSEFHISAASAQVLLNFFNFLIPFKGWT